MYRLNLLELIKLMDNEFVNEEYIRYLIHDSKYKYRDREIESIRDLISSLNMDNIYLNGFVYSYKIPALDKEFDLIKVFKDSILNIELKSEDVGEAKILKQLLKNRFYLSFLNKNPILYCFISDIKKLYKLEDNNLIEANIAELKEYIISNMEDIDYDLDKIYNSKFFLIPSLSSPIEFIKGNYYLTDRQEEIKEAILDNLENNNYFSITGLAGSGKTLLLYDIAKTLSIKSHVLILHAGMLCDGHKKIEELNHNITIEPINVIFKLKRIDAKYVFIDEAERITERCFKALFRLLSMKEYKCIFSYDEKQKISKEEDNSIALEEIKKLSKDRIYNLANSIRMNHDFKMFIDNLFDLSKVEDKKKYNGIKIEFEKDNSIAIKKAIEYQNNGSKYISYDIDRKDLLAQEYNSVCMIMDNKFYYQDKILKSKQEENKDYIYTRLLYQGLTKAKFEIILIITDEALLSNILSMIRIE